LVIVKKAAGVKLVAKGRKDKSHSCSIRGARGLPLCFQEISPKDKATLSYQMRGRIFDPTIAIGIAKYCKWGKPQVLLCAPLCRMKPFPTTFWLSCPFLAMRCSKLEASGGVRELEEFLKKRKSKWEWRAFNVKHAILRVSLLSLGERKFLQKARKNVLDKLRLSGIGGIAYRDEISIKCLHLQVASWIALREHPADDWLKARFAAIECENPGSFCQ